MWAEACAMLERAEALQREFFRPAGAGHQVTWEPPVDLFQSDDLILIVAALPGVRAQQVRLLFDGADLIVAGERAPPPVARGLELRRMEIPAGRFERRIRLPEGRYDIHERRLEDGCLTVLLRRL